MLRGMARLQRYASVTTAFYVPPTGTTLIAATYLLVGGGGSGGADLVAQVGKPGAGKHLARGSLGGVEGGTANGAGAMAVHVRPLCLGGSVLCPHTMVVALSGRGQSARGSARSPAFQGG